MAKDCGKACESVSGDKKITTFTARLALYITCLAGLWLVGCAVCSNSLDWQALTTAALAYTLSAVSVEMTWTGDKAVRLPVLHAVLLGGAISLGSWGAVIAGAYSGMGKLAAGPRQKRSVSDILFIICKPALICFASSWVYSAAGGSDLRPYSVDSIPPILLSGVTYVALSAALTSIVRNISSCYSNERTADGIEVFASWWMCIIGGYMLAIMFSVAPAYVLLVPAAGIGLTHFMLRRRSECAVQPEPQVEEPAEEVQAQAEESTGEMVFIDAVTGLANQRYLEMFLQREISRSQRLNKPFAVAVFDAKISGKELSDEALSEIGGQIKARLREYDLIARHSSGRLVAVLPESDAESACEAAERLHSSVTNIRIQGKTLNLNIGIAAYPEHADAPDELINAAHYALNTGKFTANSGVHRCRRLMKAG